MKKWIDDVGQAAGFGVPTAQLNQRSGVRCGRLLACFIVAATGVGVGSVSAAQEPCRICFYGPDNIAFATDGSAYVVDSDHKSRFRILHVGTTGALISEWSIFGAPRGAEGGPEGIAVDKKGRVQVTDAGRRRILIVSGEGRAVSLFGSDAEGPADSGHVALGHDGFVYASDGQAGEIWKFASDGKPLAMWRGEWSRPESIAVRQDGDLVVEDWGHRRILVLSPSGRVVLHIGRDGDAPGEFRNTAGLTVDASDNIYVADWNLHRVQVFDRDGKLRQVIADNGSDSLFEEARPVSPSTRPGVSTQPMALAS